MEKTAVSIRIVNIYIPKADTEIAWALPEGCVWFTLQTRDGTPIRMATKPNVVSDSQPDYFTIKTDNSWDERAFHIDPRSGIPLFFACSSAGKTVEVIMGIEDLESYLD